MEEMDGNDYCVVTHKIISIYIRSRATCKVVAMLYQYVDLLWVSRFYLDVTAGIRKKCD